MVESAEIAETEFSFFLLLLGLHLLLGRLRPGFPRLLNAPSPLPGISTASRSPPIPRLPCILMMALMVVLMALMALVALVALVALMTLVALMALVAPPVLLLHPPPLGPAPPLTVAPGAGKLWLRRRLGVWQLPR